MFMFHHNFSVLFKWFFLFHLGKKKFILNSQLYCYFLLCMDFFHTFCSSDPVGLLLSILLSSSKADGIIVFHISHILQLVLKQQFQGLQVPCVAMDLTPGKVWICQGLLLLLKVCSGGLSWRYRV